MLSFKMALRSIGANKMRAVLTMLGIIIGVMALVVLVSLVNGATSSVTNAVADLGNSLISVSVSDDKGNPITLDDIDRWMAEETVLDGIAPYANDSFSGRRGGNYGSVTVYGTTSAYYDIQGLQLSLGRWLKKADVHNHSYVCVINKAAANNLIGYEDCVGQTLSLNGVEYAVIGVLEDNEDSLTQMFTSGMMVAYIPYTSLVRLSDSVGAELSSLYISASAEHTLDQVEERMDQILYERFDEDEEAYSISSQDVLEQVMESITGVLSVLLGGIAAISLIVGGIGIMNIMLVTVTERTREIGIRKAIGASHATILTQFLMEAVVLCMMGCCLGIFLSWTILRIVSTVVASTGIVFTLDGGVVLLSVIFCFIIGVIFGLYPANKAAKMKPIDALHYGG